MPRRVGLVRLAALAAAFAVGLSAAPQSLAAPPLRIGFFDDLYSGAPQERDTWLQRTVNAESDVVRINVGWVAPNTPRRPPGFDARNPADPAYNFANADASIKAASSRGLDVLALFVGAPRWAEGPDRPADAPPGTWRPDPAALRDYGVALARRYSGSFPDPAEPGRSLPAVRSFQVWNEPNLSIYLTPQWAGRRAVSPVHYRRMLSAFYGGVKSVRRDALVVTAGTAPFGDPDPGGRRIMPARFVRELLCLRRGRGSLQRASCPAPARFDVLAHHPYPIGAPSRRTLNSDDVSISGMYKLRDLLRAAERSGRALPRGKRHRLWATEVSYDSRPPDPDGVLITRHARWLQQSLSRLSRQGVDTIFWFRIRDAAPEPSFAATNQSGVYFRDGRPKPALQAFRFPFVAERARRGIIPVWGRSPAAGQVTIERRRGGRWQRILSVKAARHGIFQARVPRVGRGIQHLRARIGAERSLLSSLGERA